MSIFQDITSYLPPVVQDNLHVRLIAMDDVDLNHRWQANDVRSPFWRLYLNDRKGAVVVASGKSYPLLKRELFLIPAWVRFDCRNTARLRHFFIHFDLVGFSPMVMRKLWDKPLRLAGSTDLASVATRIGNCVRADQRDFTRVILEAKALVCCALGRAMPQQEMTAAQWALLLHIPASIEPAIRHIQSHIPEPVGNVALARLCHRSRSHFIRMFRKAVGMTPKQYILERRVAWAAEKLALSAESIETIATASGFQNRFYFTRAFTRIMGLPPARYRKSTF